MKIDTTRPRLKIPAGLPKELIAVVFRLVLEDGWTTDQIRLACDAIDQLDADKRKRGDRGPGPHQEADAKAVQVMLALCIRTGEQSPRALAEEAWNRGYGGRAYPNSADSKKPDITRMAAVLRLSPYFRGLKIKSR